MSKRILFSLLTALTLIVALVPLSLGATPAATPASVSASEYSLPEGPARSQLSVEDRAVQFEFDRPRTATKTTRVWLMLEDAPLVELMNARGPMSQVAQDNYLARLATRQTAVANQARALGATELARLRHLVNVIAMEVPVGRLADLSAIPGVEGVHPVQDGQVDLENSVPWIGAEYAQETLGYDGSGLGIAIIDSGVDYTHAAFGGPGTVMAYTEATTGTNATVITDTFAGLTWPDASIKVVDGRDFVGANWSGGGDPLMPDPDPIDDGPGAGHGTNVASNAAGLLVTDTMTSDVLVHQGVAPGADIYAYKVCSSITTSCSGIAMAQAMEWAAVTDTVDVINMSIGAIYGGAYEDYITTVAAQNAADAGVLVSISAGNSGDRPYITGAPSVADGALSVAASYADGQETFGFKINTPVTIAQTYPAYSIQNAPLATSEITESVVYVGEGCTLDSYPPGLVVTDTIALIQRGSCTFASKVLNAEAKGAAAAVIFNNVPGVPNFTVGSTVVNIPALAIIQEHGLLISNTMATDVVSGTIGPNIIAGLPELTDAIADFSSRGPRIWDNQIKPDITAPGPGVYSADVGTGNQASRFGGTSSAAPHVAGTMALMRDKYPAWPVDYIYNALMNTAVTELYLQETGSNPNYGGTGTRAPVARQGAGRVQVDDALEALTVAWDDAGGRASLSYGYQPITDTWAMTKTVRVWNALSGSPTDYRTYEVTYTNVFTDDQGAGVTVNLSTDVLTVTMGTSTTFDVGLHVDAAGLKEWTLDGGPNGDNGAFMTDLEFDGFVTISEVLGAGTIVVPGDLLNLPFHLLPHKAAEVQAEQTMLTLDYYTSTQMLTLTNSAAYTGTADLYAWMADDTLDDVVHGEITPTENLDIDHLGVRAYNDPFNGLTIEFAVVAKGPRAHPYIAEFDIVIDTDKDGNADYFVWNMDLGVFGFSTGENYVVYQPAGSSSLFLAGYYNDTDLNSKVMRLPIVASLLGLNASDLDFNFYVQAWDPYFEIPVVDRAPDAGWLSYDGNNPKVYPSDWFPTIAGSTAVTVTGMQDGAIKSADQMGLLALYRDQDPALEAEGIAVDITNAGASSRPVDLRTDVLGSEEIPVHFTHAVSTTTVSFSISPTVGISVTWPATDTAHIAPVTSFGLGESYELSHGGGQGPGVTFPPNSWTFTVEKIDMYLPVVFKNY